MSLEAQSKTSRNLSLVDISDAQTYTHHNDDTNEIMDDIEEITPPWLPV